MKINWQFNISLQWIRIPLIPYISLTEIKPVVVVQTIPAPEAEILPIPVKRKARIKPSNEDIKSLNVNPELRYRRLVGEMRGTEVYRTSHARQDLIQWFVERSNSPLSMKQMQTMKKSPFTHKYEKCNPECTHRIISYGVITRILRNHITDKELREGIPQVITFEKVKKGYRLTKDFYKSVYGKGTLIDQWQPPTPQVQLPEETSSALTISSVAAYIKENSELRR